MKHSIHFSIELTRRTERLEICGVGYHHPNDDDVYSYDIDQVYCNDDRIPLEFLHAMDIMLSEDDIINDQILCAVREKFLAAKQRPVFDVLAACLSPYDGRWRA